MANRWALNSALKVRILPAQPTIMVEASQIRDTIVSFVASGDTDEFVMNFSILSHDIHKNGTPEAIELANKIEFLMADVHSECRYHRKSVGEFKEAVAELA